MFDLSKLFARDARRRADHPDTGNDSALPRGAGLEDEYESLISAQCLRWGISGSSITIEVRQIGRGPDGRDVYFGLIRLARWERESALRVLLGLPLLEAKIRKVVRSMWLVEVSHFGGLWLHASEQLYATDAASELRRLMVQLAPMPGPTDSSLEEPFSASERGGEAPATT